MYIYIFFNFSIYRKIFQYIFFKKTFTHNYIILYYTKYILNKCRFQRSSNANKVKEKGVIRHSHHNLGLPENLQPK